MWSKFTEYAGSVAEIVAPPTGEEEHDGDASSKAQIGDELWSRFTNIVAPTDGQAPGSSNGKQRSAYEEEDDEDEQERYISELERALLQKKKQNEMLEEKIRELQTNSRPSSKNDPSNEVEASTATAAEKDAEIERLRGELEKMRAQAEEGKRTTQTEMEAVREKDAREAARLREEVAVLQQRVMELEVANATLREAHATSSDGAADSERHDSSSEEGPRASIFPVLVQTALVLSKTVSQSGAALEVGTTEAAVAAQLGELSEKVRRHIDQSEARFAKLHASLVSFCGMHGEKIESQGDVFCTEVQSTLGLLSHRLSKGKADAQELAKLQEQLKMLSDNDHKNQKTILALQTQLSGVKASKQKNDASLASRESEMMAVVEKKDQRIANLQASEDQLKQSLQHLGKELEDAHAEIDELDKLCRDQEQKLNKLQRRDEEANGLQIAYEELQSRLQAMEKSTQEYEQGYLELLQEAEAVKRKTEEEKAELVATTEAQVLSADKQVVYDLEARLSASEADKLVAIQDAARLQTELDALEKVLLQFRTDHKHQRERLLELEQALDELRRGRQQQAVASGSGAISEDDFRRVMDVLAKRTLECDQLREALENLAKRFSSEVVLDKSLAAQLVVSYLESDKKDEVLQLMSRMMGFSEEQKRRAGILGDGQVVIPGNGGGGLFSSIFGIQSASGQASDATASVSAATDTDGKKLNELWTNFLIDEAKR